MPIPTIADRVQEITLTTGTGTLALGGASNQCQSFATGIGSGNQCTYTVLDGNGMAWFTAYGTVGSGTLTRDSVITGSSGIGVNVSLSSVTPHTVFVDTPASRIGGLSYITGTIFNGTTSTVTYTIPQTWNHLRVLANVRSTTAGAGNTFLYCQLNGDTGANYTYQNAGGNASSPTANQGANNANGMELGQMSLSGDVTNAGVPIVVDFPFYNSTTFNKSCVGSYGLINTAANTGLFTFTISNHWANTAAISSMVFNCASGNFVTGSQIQVYGY